MAIAGAHFIGRNSVDAVQFDSFITLTTVSAECISSENAIGGSIIEVVSDEPCWIGTSETAFSETDLLNKQPLVWFDAFDLGDTYSDGDDITSWADASGNGDDAVEGTDCPSYDADGLDGTRPSAHFDGSEFLNAPISASSGQFIQFIVGKIDTAAGTAAILDYTAGGTVEYDADNDKFDYYTSTSNATAAGVEQDSPFLLTCSPDGIWQNGEQLVSSMTIADKALTAMAIGSDAANTGDFLTGEISAILVYEADNISTHCQEVLEWYLANLYGITLDSGHTYANAVPQVATVSTSNGFYLPANTVRRVLVDANHHIAVKRDGASDATVSIAVAKEI